MHWFLRQTKMSVHLSVTQSPCALCIFPVSKGNTTISHSPLLVFVLSVRDTLIKSGRCSVGDPGLFGADPDPGIRTSDKWIRNFFLQWLQGCKKIFFFNIFHNLTTGTSSVLKGPGSRSAPLTNGSGSWRPKNMRILRIRIPNTEKMFSKCAFFIDSFYVQANFSVCQKPNTGLPLHNFFCSDKLFTWSVRPALWWGWRLGLQYDAFPICKIDIHWIDISRIQRCFISRILLL